MEIGNRHSQHLLMTYPLIFPLMMKKLVLMYIGLGLAVVFLIEAIGQRVLGTFKIQGLD